MKAIIDGSKILCGRCHGLIGKTMNGYTMLLKELERLNIEDSFVSIKCNSKHNGYYCNEINEVQIK